jgi:hypothetical protein
MSKLADMLKQTSTKIQTKSSYKISNKIFEDVATSYGVATSNQSNTDTKFDISEENLAKVRASVATIDTTGKDRTQIIIGMYGGIVDPDTGKRYVIPCVNYLETGYIYRYAEMMKTLVDTPDEFKKIMNWE